MKYEKLTKNEILWIRACKSKNPTKRLNSLYKRIYLTTCGNYTIHLAQILAKIGGNHRLFSCADIIDGLNSECLNHGAQSTYEERCLSFFLQAE